MTHENQRAFLRSDPTHDGTVGTFLPRTQPGPPIPKGLYFWIRLTQNFCTQRPVSKKPVQAAMRGLSSKERKGLKWLKITSWSKATV